MRVPPPKTPCVVHASSKIAVRDARTPVAHGLRYPYDIRRAVVACTTGGTDPMKSTYCRTLALAGLLVLALSAASCGALPTAPVQDPASSGGATGTAVSQITEEGTPGNGPSGSSESPAPIIIGGGSTGGSTGTAAHGHGHAWGRNKH